MSPFPPVAAASGRRPPQPRARRLLRPAPRPRLPPTAAAPPAHPPLPVAAPEGMKSARPLSAPPQSSPSPRTPTGTPRTARGKGAKEGLAFGRRESSPRSMRNAALDAAVVIENCSAEGEAVVSGFAQHQGRPPAPATGCAARSA